MNYGQVSYKNIFLIVFVLLWPCLGLSTADIDQEPTVAIQQSQKKTFYRGEKVNFYIKLLTPGAFSGSPRFELPELSTGLLYQVQARPVLGTENVDGKSYTTQLHEIWFFPQQSGQITIPEMSVTFSTAENTTKQEQQYRKKTEPFTLEVKPIPGVPDNEFIIVTDDFTSSQDWKPEISQGLVGDAVIRTVTIRAKNMVSIFLPDITTPEIEGVSIYREPPEVIDRNERGEATAERKDVITYVFETDGEYLIPDIVITWWDSTANTVRENVVQGLTATIAVNPNRVEEEAGTTRAVGNKSINLKLAALICAVCFLIGFIFLKKSHQIKDSFYRFKKTRSQSEKAHFFRLKKACDSSNPVEAYNALYLWIYKKFEYKDMKSLMNNGAIGFDFQKAFEDLNKQLFGEDKISANSSWNGDDLYRSVNKLRKIGIQRSTDTMGATRCCRLNY